MGDGSCYDDNKNALLSVCRNSVEEIAKRAACADATLAITEAVGFETTPGGSAFKYCRVLVKGVAEADLDAFCKSNGFKTGDFDTGETITSIDTSDEATMKLYDCWKRK